jgi:PAS domain S-box-containing protein
MEIDLARLLDALPGVVWSASPTGRAEHVGHRWLEYAGLTSEQALGFGWTAALHPDDAPGLLTALAEIIATGERGEIEVRLRRHDGEHRWRRTFVFPLNAAAGANELWYGVFTDIEDFRRAEATLAAEKQLLELVAKGGPLLETLDTLCRQVEELAKTGYCSILLVDADRGAFRVGAARNLPPEYSAAFEGRRIDPTDAPAALAVSLKTPVNVADPAQDARWATASLPQYMAAHGLRSGWLTPILSGGGDVLGVFAAYHAQPQDPTQEERELIERFVHIAGIAIERDQAEAALRTRQAELRLAHDQLTEAQRLSKTGSTYWNVEKDEHHWSEEMYRILEVDPSTPVSVNLIRDLVHPEDREEMEAAIALAGSGQEHAFKLRVLTASGALKHVRVFARPTTDRNTFVGALQDVTETELADAALRSSEAKLRRAYDSLAEAQRLSKTGSFITDLVADDHDWSDEAYRIFNFDPTAPVTLETIRAIVHPDDLAGFDSMIAEAIAGVDVDFIFRVVTGDGALKHVRGLARIFERVAGRPKFVGALQDVTERKAAEEAIERARAELAHVARAATLSALTASIAHEVNQPLAGIITNASTCLRMLALDPPNVEGARATAERTIRDGDRASEVITRLRGLFTRKAPAFEPVDLNSAAAEVLALCSAQLQTAKVVVSCAYDDDLPPVSGDRVQLQQVILNFLTNAADAMKGVEDRPRNLTIGTARETADRIRLYVRDSGIGLDPEHLERMFDPFYTTKAEGMGVGLAVSRSIIETHEGRLWAEPNEDGPGATFAFSLTAAFALAAVAE